MAKISKRQLEFLRFSVVGAINTGIDFTVFAILFGWGISLLPAHALSYSCGILNSFFLNRKWTFKEKGTSQSLRGSARRQGRQLVRFIVLNLFSLTTTYGLLVWFHYNWGWPMLLSRLMAVVFSLAINFLGSRLWVFRQDCLRIA